MIKLSRSSQRPSLQDEMSFHSRRSSLDDPHPNNIERDKKNLPRMVYLSFVHLESSINHSKAFLELRPFLYSFFAFRTKLLELSSSFSSLARRKYSVLRGRSLKHCTRRMNIARDRPISRGRHLRTLLEAWWSKVYIAREELRVFGHVSPDIQRWSIKGKSNK